MTSANDNVIKPDPIIAIMVGNPVWVIGESTIECYGWEPFAPRDTLADSDGDDGA